MCFCVYRSVILFTPFLIPAINSDVDAAPEHLSARLKATTNATSTVHQTPSVAAAPRSELISLVNGTSYNDNPKMYDDQQ